MIRLRIASKNPGKWKEFNHLLAGCFTCLPLDPDAPDVEETGDTYRSNALLKATAFYQTYQCPVLSDDSGLEIDVLQGKPGLHSARLGGADISWPERFQFLYSLLAPFPREQWTARFRTVLCLYWGQAEPLFFEGVTEGRIQNTPAGSAGFGYDPLFYSTDLNQSFGTASEAQKSRVSHRARAVRALLEWVEKNPHKLS